MNLSGFSFFLFHSITLVISNIMHNIRYNVNVQFSGPRCSSDGHFQSIMSLITSDYGLFLLLFVS